MKGLQIFILLMLCSLSTYAQVFPGDADDNGIVDHYDILPIAYAYGTVGPARVEAGSDSSELEVLALWEEAFPSGHNYAYADANGDGLIDFLDLITVHNNYNFEHSGSFTAVLTQGIAGVDAPIYFDLPTGPPITANTSLEIPIYLGTDDFPLDSMHGIAFSIEYNSDFFETVQLELNPGWLNESSLFLYEAFPQSINEEGMADLGKLDVALAHLGKENTSSGYGQIGTLNIIIQDVLVDLMPPDKDSAGVSITINEVKLVDANYQSIPIVWDSLELMIYQPDALSPVSDVLQESLVNIFPNPFSNRVHIHSTEPILAVEAFTMLGSQLWSRRFKGNQQITLNRNHFAVGKGAYLLRIHTQKGIIQRKLVLVE